jgi:hypothetical protein
MSVISESRPRYGFIIHTVPQPTGWAQGLRLPVHRTGSGAATGITLRVMSVGVQIE